VLDIGGDPVATRGLGGAVEPPPIPCHIHAGDVREDGTFDIPTGKLEAYYFPGALGSMSTDATDADATGATGTGDIDDSDARLATITRLGLRPDVTQDDVLRCLRRFAKDDSMYGLLNRFEARDHESWTIQPGIIHAPGPRLTLEMQRAQDDSMLLAWRMGEYWEAADEGREREGVRSVQELKRRELLKGGLEDEEHFMQQVGTLEVRVIDEVYLLSHHWPVIDFVRSFSHAHSHSHPHSHPHSHSHSHSHSHTHTRTHTRTHAPVHAPFPSRAADCRLAREHRPRLWHTVAVAAGASRERRRQ
jgi:hypothetical protein